MLSLRGGMSITALLEDEIEYILFSLLDCELRCDLECNLLPVSRIDESLEYYKRNVSHSETGRTWMGIGAGFCTTASDL